jgi:hypothetical protein
MTEKHSLPNRLRYFFDKTIDISQTAIMRGEIAVGYRNNGIVVFNPAKSELIRFSDDGAIIVLAEE